MNRQRDDETAEQGTPRATRSPRGLRSRGLGKGVLRGVLLALLGAAAVPLACSSSSSSGSDAGAGSSGSAGATSSSSSTGDPPPDAKTDPPPDPGPLVLRDVTAELGLPKATRECMALRDLDGDGKVDLLLTPLADDEKSAALAVFKNKGDGSFERFDVPMPTTKFGACSVADYDGDGKPDIAVIDRLDGTLRLVRNESQGSPKFVLDAALVVGAPDPQRLLVSFVDIDGDGFPELWLASSPIVGQDGGPNTSECVITEDDFLCTEINPPPAGSPELFHNDAGKGFSKSPMIIPPPYSPWPWGLSAVDYDEDGAVDLFLSYDYTFNQFLHNTKGGLVDILPELGAKVYNNGMGAAFSDYNHDGKWDFWVADLGPDQLWMSGPQGLGNKAKEAGIVEATRTRMHWGAISADFNNDGYDDVYAGNQLIALSAEDLANTIVNELPGSLDVVDDVYVSVRGETFNAQAIPFPAAHNRPQVITAVGDFDGDGRPDLLEGPGPLRLLHNETPLDPAWSHTLDVRLIGKSSPLHTQGAVVNIEVDGAPAGKRASEGRDGRGNSSDVLHFGLGGATSVSAIHVLWPGGQTQTLKGPIAAGQLIEITRP
jgi:hypothetical protein